MREPGRLWLVAVLCLIWGSTWLVIKVGLEELPPFLSAGLRFTIASIVLFAVARLRGVRTPSGWPVHIGLLAIGLFGFGLSYGSVYWSEQYLTSGLTAVLFATQPFAVMAMAHVAVPGERMTLLKALGVGLGFLGTLLIFGGDLDATHPRALTAAAVVLLSPAASAASNVGIKRWGPHLHPFHLTALPMAYGAAALLAISFGTEDLSNVNLATPVAVGSILYLAILGSVVAFLIYYSLLLQVPVTTLALVTYVYPVVAVGLGYLVLGETLGGRVLAGTLLILVGIAVATRRRVVRGPGRT